MTSSALIYSENVLILKLITTFMIVQGPFVGSNQIQVTWWKTGNMTFSALIYSENVLIHTRLHHEHVFVLINNNFHGCTRNT